MVMEKEIEDMKYWVDTNGKRIWQNKEDYRIGVIRKNKDSDDVTYTKDGKPVGAGFLFDFMEHEDEYYAIQPALIDNKLPNSQLKFIDDNLHKIKLEFYDPTRLSEIETNVVEYNIDDPMLEIITKYGEIIYYKLSDIERIKIYKNKENQL